MTQLRAGDHVLVVHPFGVAHRARCTGAFSGIDIWQVIWVHPLPSRDPHYFSVILASDEGISWLKGHEHSEETVKALCAAAALVRNTDA